ncbi:MAG: hypothetical protein ACUZ8H_11155 [Candidatus Anammoxibacter sp.]
MVIVNAGKRISRTLFAITAIVLISCACNGVTGKPLPPIGARVTLYNKSGSVAAGLTKSKIEEFRKLSVGFGTAAFDAMFDTDTILEVENNSTALVIDSVTSIIRHFIKVRILDGKHEGRTVWVVSKDISDVDDNKFNKKKTVHTNNRTNEEEKQEQPEPGNTLLKKQFNPNTGNGITLNEQTRERISGIYNIGSTVTLKYNNGINLYKGLSLNKVAFRIRSGVKARIIDAIITPEKNQSPNIYKVEVQQGSDKYIGWVTAYVVYD